MKKHGLLKKARRHPNGLTHEDAAAQKRECSSPDDNDTATLFAAADLLEQGNVERTRMVEETLIHLYCRVGLSVRHHPHDLPDYLQAWGHWKQLCKQIEEGIGII